METRSISLESILEAAALRSTGAAGDWYLTGGFLMISSLLGLLAIIVAFWYHRNNLSLFKRSCIMFFSCQKNRLMNIQVIHNSVIFLLIIDALNLITAIILGAELVGSFCNGVINCFHIGIVWSLSRWFGVIIHLLNASLSIYHLCYQPLSVTRVCIICSLIGVLFGIIIALFLYVPEAVVFTLAAFVFLFALSVIVTCRAPTLFPSTAILKKWIMVVAMCNFLVVYVPTFIVQCLLYSSHSSDKLMNYVIAYVNVLVFTNCHLILDGLQCALVLNLPSGEEQQQQHQQVQQLSFPNPGYTVSTTTNQQ